MVSKDASTWQNILTAGATALGVLGAAVLAARKALSGAKVEGAVANASVATANAQTELYALLKDRLAAVESKVKDLEEANAKKDEVIRKLRDHIDDLEDSMREHGLNPPKLILPTL